MSTDKHTVQFCCGTTCDAEENLAYVKQLEDDLKAAHRANRVLLREYADLNDMFTVMMRLHPLEIKHGPTKGDTQGAT